GGKLAKEKLKEQLQKIALKRTGGQKTDELLGHDGGGPEGLPHSIIVTTEGTEGDAPVLNGDEANRSASLEELPLDDVSAASTHPKAKQKFTNTKKTIKYKTPGKENPAKVKPPNAKQMTLGFETAGTTGKRSQRTGKRHGTKKAKK